MPRPDAREHDFPFVNRNRRGEAQKGDQPQLPPNERIRGRRGVELRRRRLADEPLCRDCKAKGIWRLATVPDHIIPLSQGGTDTDDNIRCLCNPCHDKRTAEQFDQKYRQPIGIDGWPKE